MRGLGGMWRHCGMGSTHYAAGTTIPAFTVTDLGAIIGGSVTNGGPNAEPADFLASLIFSYATFNGSTYTLTSDPTNATFVVFGFNDNGFGDDNHDDFVGVMALTPGGLARRDTNSGCPPLVRQCAWRRFAVPSAAQAEQDGVD